jgi:hypothetical protein
MLLLASLAVLAGCDRTERMGKVRGHVTLDGRPVSQGLVLFSNRTKGVHILATLDNTGDYELQMAQGFGLPLGTYQVAVNPPVPTPPMPGAPPPPPIDSTIVIPAQYLQPETSGLTTTVEPGENTFDIAMHSRR